MTPTIEQPRGPIHTEWHEVSDLYHTVLKHFYCRKRPDKAALPALRLLRMLDRLDPEAETLLGMSGRWLVAEMDGDLEEAIRYREKEIAVLRDHIAKGILTTGGLEVDEFSDRLDLLASNYLDVGRCEDALAALADSEAYCKEHGLPFDGKDIRTDVKRAMRKRKKKPAKAKAG